MSLKKMMLIVDGPTEEGSIRKRFEKDYFESPEIRLGPGNGKDFSIKGYAQGVLPTLKFALSSNIRAIILIPDLEKRRIDCERFMTQLKNECISELIKDSKFKKENLLDQIFVCPPNIMFENWIISDIDTVSNECSEFESPITQELFDGTNGTSIIQKYINCKYKKTVHGPKFFKKTLFENSIQNSPSFELFWSIFNQLKEKHCA